MMMLDILGWIEHSDLLRDRFYWLHMMDEAKDYVNSCRRCQMAKGRQQLAPLQPYHADAPWN